MSAAENGQGTPKSAAKAQMSKKRQENLSEIESNAAL
jgi:hypothetical protein